MSGGILRFPWTSQPQTPTIGATSAGRLLVWSPSASLAVRKGSAALTATPYGIGYLGNASGSNYWEASPTRLVSSSDTWTMGATFTTTQATVVGGYTIIGERPAAGNEILKITCLENGNTPNACGIVIRNNAGTLNRINGTKVINDGKQHTVVLVKRSAADYELFVDGVSDGTLTASYPASAFSAACPLIISNDLQGPAAFSSVLQGFVELGVAWTRARAKSHYDNPWQLFAPIQRTIWVPAAAGGGTTISGALGTAVASGFKGNVNANRAIAGALGTATASGFKGVVNANRTIAGALGTAVASGFTGTVANSTNTTINGNLGVAAASGFTGGVNANRTIAGALGVASASGFTGTVGANRRITGALGTAVASGFTGTVNNSNDTTINGNIGTAVASGFNGGVAFNRFLAGLLGTAVASGFTGTVGTTSPAIGRPASDTSNSGWTASTGSDLYAMLDEVTPDDADYIVTTATGSICEMELQTTAYPGTSAQKLSYRASSSTGNSVIVRLKNTGGATVRTETQVLTSTDTLYEITLTAPEIAAITSGAMSVELESA